VRIREYVEPFPAKVDTLTVFTFPLVDLTFRYGVMCSHGNQAVYRLPLSDMLKDYLAVGGELNMQLAHKAIPARLWYERAISSFECDCGRQARALRDDDDCLEPIITFVTIQPGRREQETA
jgi:hypothetical protein